MGIRPTLERFIYGSGIVYLLVRDLAIVVVVGVLLHFFVFSIYPVQGESMKPTMSPYNLVFINKIAKANNVKRGQIVILKFPADKDSQLLVKRVIGLPGEKITITKTEVKINDKVLTEGYLTEPVGLDQISDFVTEKTLAYNEYFVMGDNRLNSSDSRIFGAVQKSDISGRAELLLWPFDKFGFLAIPNY